MSLIRTSFLNAIAVAVRTCSLFGINKVLAVTVGPTGFVLVGQFYNAIQVITTFASGAINTGIVRYTAEYASERHKQIQFWRTGGTIILLFSLVSSALVIFFRSWLSKYFLRSEEYSSVFVWFGLGLTFFTLNAYLMAILNGLKDIRRYVAANVAGSLISLGLVIFAAWSGGLKGALIALSVYQSVVFIATILLCLRTDWFHWSNFLGNIDGAIARSLFHFTLMVLVSSALGPLSQILVRNRILDTLSTESAGYWEALWKFSTAYLMFLTSTISVYYLPRLSEIRGNVELKQEVFKTAKLVTSTVAGTAVVIYFLRHFIVKILFSEAFLPVTEYFTWQLVGDVIKISSWIFSYVFIARSFTFLFILSELLFNISFVSLVYLFVPRFGIQGATVSYAVSYCTYFIFTLLALRSKEILK
jgi:polysaccharide transporter, PST family